MNRQLLLSSIRSVLIRLEETIIFSLIERAQFRQNQAIYEEGRWPQATGRESIMGFLLHQTEKNHALLRRYTSPDEHPFFDDLPEPVLPQLKFEENPLQANHINLHREIRRIYEDEIIPFVCEAGDDSQYGSSSVADVNCLQALSKRIHYGKFVAESKYRNHPEAFQAPLQQGDQAAIYDLITDRETEQRVLDRVARKALTYGQDLDLPDNHQSAAAKDTAANLKIKPEQVIAIYRQWIIPMTKEVEVMYLLQRPASIL